MWQFWKAAEEGPITMSVKLKRIVFTVLTVFWMGVIFTFSAFPSTESESLSTSVGHVVGMVFVPGFSERSVLEQEKFASGIDHAVRKTAHATEYAVLGILLTLTLTSYLGLVRRRLWVSLGVGAAYASTDEFHQIFVPGRGPAVLDVGIDSLGVLIGISIVFLIQKHLKISK